LSLLTERMAHVSRDRQDIRNHLMAMTSGSRLSAIGMVIGSIIAVAALLWLEPEYIEQYWKHPRGPMVLAVAGVLEMIGIFWVWRILKVGY
jgi:tight adherence protein B